MCILWFGPLPNCSRGIQSSDEYHGSRFIIRHQDLAKINEKAVQVTDLYYFLKDACTRTETKISIHYNQFRIDATSIHVYGRLLPVLEIGRLYSDLEF